jgi:hypothetical protein
MARRKRLHGLGGTPEHHAEKAKVFFRHAIGAFESATKSAKAGDCFRAHDEMNVAYLHTGRAEAHLEEVPGYVGRERMRHALQDETGRVEGKADGAYHTACIIGKSLSGTRRRRSRR